MRVILPLLLFIFSSSDLFSQARPSGSLKGSRVSLARQNILATSCNLSRIPDSASLRRMIRRGYLVRAPERGVGYYLDPNMGSNLFNDYLFRYARPWVVQGFLVREGRHFAREFPGARFKVTSLVRTEEYQRFLIEKRHNPNAARGVSLLTRSPHLTGSALDISRKGLTSRQIMWLRGHLLELQRLNRVIAVEERRTNSFHVFVIPPCVNRRRR